MLSQWLTLSGSKIQADYLTNKHKTVEAEAQAQAELEAEGTERRKKQVRMMSIAEPAEPKRSEIK